MRKIPSALYAWVLPPTRISCRRSPQWQPDPSVYRTMYDNIGLILEYMGILCSEIAKALEDDDAQKVSTLLEEQKSVLKSSIKKEKALLERSI